MDGELKIFSGGSNRGLAARIARTLGRPLGEAMVGHFPDGESHIQILENVRGTDAFVVQSTCAPVDRNLMQLLIMIDALRRASAGRVTALIPYFGYARQEKKVTGREPITAKLVANILEAAGASRIVTLDLHAPAVQGFFDIPVDHLLAAPLLAAAIERMGLQKPVIVSPDAGGVTRAHDFSQRVTSAPLAVVFKNRTAADRIEHLQIVGDVEGRDAIVVDDQVSTGHTLVEASEALRKRGARSVYACAVHPVFAGDALERLQDAPIERIFITDTIPIEDGLVNGKIQLVHTHELFGEAVRRIHNDESVTALFK